MIDWRCPRGAARRAPTGWGPVRAEDGRPRIVAVTLDPSFEDLINGFVDRSATGTTLTMPARVASACTGQIARALEQVTGAGHHPLVIASPQVRSVVRQLIEPSAPMVAVLGYNEVADGVEVESVALVTAPEEVVAGAA